MSEQNKIKEVKKGMYFSDRCQFCVDFGEKTEPYLCERCRDKIFEWLNSKGWTILQKESQLFEPKPDEIKQTYSLTCDSCGKVFYSKEASPSPQLCSNCKEPNPTVRTIRNRPEVCPTGWCDCFSCEHRQGEFCIRLEPKPDIPIELTIARPATNAPRTEITKVVLRRISPEEIVITKDCELEIIGDTENYFVKQRAVDRAIAQAQLEADQAIVDDLCGYCDTPLLTEGRIYEIEKQAKREVFEKIEQHFAGTWQQGNYLYYRFLMSPSEWQAYKSKELGE